VNEELPTYQIGGKNGLVRLNLISNHIVIGDSLNSRELSERKGRETIARSGRPSEGASIVGVYKIHKTNITNCVQFAKTEGYKGTGHRYAKDIPTSGQPKVGGFVITYESWMGHIAVITKITGQTITVEEAGYIPGWITKRDMNINSRVIKGFAQ